MLSLPVRVARDAGAGRAARVPWARAAVTLAPPPMELLYGFDPLCGWCYGAVPAVRALREAEPGLPVRLVMAGLVSGARVGPYAEAEGYIRAASDRLRQETGRAPLEAFFRLIRTPGVRGDSGPPCVAIHAVERAVPEATLPFAHAVIEAHFEEGADLNAPETYAPLLARHAPGVALPNLHDPALAEAAWAEGRRLGVRSFPTLALRRDGGGGWEPLPPIYAPEALVRRVREAASHAPHHAPP